MKDNGSRKWRCQFFVRWRTIHRDHGRNRIRGKDFWQCSIAAGCDWSNNTSSDLKLGETPAKDDILYIKKNVSHFIHN